jgi:hypothetical protein
MKDWLFDPPWWAPIFAAMVALVLLYQGVQTAKNAFKLAGVIVAGLAAGWMVLSSYVETGKEVAIRQTKELAAAVDKRDWNKFKSLIDPNARFAIYANRDELVEGAAKTVEKVGVKDIVVNNFTAVELPGGYDVTFTATASIGVIDQRAPTNWKLTWVKAPNGTELLNQVEALPSATMGTDPVMDRLAK